MKNLFISLFVLLVINAEAKIISSDTVVVNNTKFLFVKSIHVSEANHSKLDTVLQVYRIENGARKYLLAHNIYDYDADCNSVFEDFGTYEIHGDSVIFKTEFSVERDKNVGLPYRQKQIYVVKDDGKMILVFDKSEMEDGTWRDNLNPQ